MYILTFDRKKNAMICGHFETSKSDDECAKCLESYNESEEWLSCPVCHHWYHEDCFFCVQFILSRYIIRSY